MRWPWRRRVEVGAGTTIPLPHLPPSEQAFAPSRWSEQPASDEALKRKFITEAVAAAKSAHAAAATGTSNRPTEATQLAATPTTGRLVREAHFWIEKGGSKELATEILKATHPEVFDNPEFRLAIHDVPSWPEGADQILYYAMGTLLTHGAPAAPPDNDSWIQQNGTAHGKRFLAIYMREPL